jgi:hypothetical protein
MFQCMCTLLNQVKHVCLLKHLFPCGEKFHNSLFRVININFIVVIYSHTTCNNKPELLVPISQQLS